MFYDRKRLKFHLNSRGFMDNYTKWDAQGDPFRSKVNIGESSITMRDEFTNQCKDRVIDDVGSEIVEDDEAMFDQELSNSYVQKFYDSLNDVDFSFWNGCKAHIGL